MMRNSKVLLSILTVIVFIFGACKTTQHQLNVINIKEAQGIRHYITIYSLPKTVIRVNLKVVRTSYKRGPYYKYAKSNLGLTDVIEEDGEKWKITGVEFETYAIADTNNVYIIETNDESNKIQLKLSDCGLLEGINLENGINYNVKHTDIQEYKNHQDTELRVFTEHKLVDNDDINFDDVPLPKAILAKRSLSERASQLAGKILALREDRAAILVGDGYTETMPDGEALKTMIEKIDLIQEKYLSMFKGKIKRDRFQYSFDYIPEEPRKITQSILFRFSELNGIVENTDMSGIPIIIEIESYENLKEFEKFKKKQVYLKRAAKEKEMQNGLYYRIPEMGIVRLLANDDVLMQEKIQLSQFGSIHSLPLRYFDGNYIIELYTEQGSLKSIKKIEKKNIEKSK